jgi:hypothetical protein
VRGNGLTGSFWPTDRQKLLLRAAICGGEASLRAWRRLRPDFDLDALEAESSVLLPLVHRQLVAAGVQDPLLRKLRGMHQRTWYVNQLTLDRLAPALAAVQECDAEPLVVAGWELPAHYYGDFGVRAVANLELLVRPEHAGRAGQALVAAGWPSVSRSRHRASFKAPNGEECVIHGLLFHEFDGGDGSADTAELWDASAELDLKGIAARRLGASDELLHVCLRGARMGRWPTLMWLADAMAVLSSASAEIDWDRIVQSARRLRASLRLRDALVFLRDELDAPVPNHAVERLEQVSVQRRERFAHRATGARWPLIGPAPESLTQFVLTTADRNLPAALLRLPAFLRDEWSLERRSQVPLAAARKGIARVGSIRGARAQARLRRTNGQNVVE